MKKFLLMTAAVAALSFGAYADDVEIWSSESDFIIDGTYNKNGVANAVHFTYNSEDGVFECDIDRIWGKFKIHQYKNKLLSGTTEWRPQYGNSETTVGHLINGIEFKLGVKFLDTDMTPGDIEIGYPEGNNFPVIHNAHVIFNPAQLTLTITGEHRDDLWVVGDLPTGYKQEADGANKLTFTEGKYKGVINFGDNTSTSGKAVKIAGYKYCPNYAYNAGESVSIIVPDDKETWTHTLKQHFVDGGKTTINEKSITGFTSNKAMRANLTGEWNVELDPQTNVFAVSPLSENDTESAVAEIAADENAPVEYFNMQGVKVENPENGIYVRKQGSKVSKVVVK